MLRETGKLKIGLEIHVQLTNLRTKLFCPCPSDYRGKKPNENVCPICLGLPGTLPQVNKRAVESAIAVCLALGAKVQPYVVFSRKNYFYPDMNKNYQITQYDKAGGTTIGVGGYVTISLDGERKRIPLRRIQIEEDPGRLLHVEKNGVKKTYIDYNRAGIALVEIVTEPAIHQPKEARLVLEKVQTTLEHLGVLDPSFEGSMRCDANISYAGGARIEIKNISSFKEVEQALRFEQLRLEYLPKMESTVTKRWGEKEGITATSREKEMEEDYRYFPEPDIPPIIIEDKIIENIRRSLPELPDERIERFVREYGISERLASILVSEKPVADFFEKTVRILNDPEEVAYWLMNEVVRRWRELGIDYRNNKFKPEGLAKLIRMIKEGHITKRMAKQVLWEIVSTGEDAEEYVKRVGLKIIRKPEELVPVITSILDENPKLLKDAFKNERVIDYICGEVQKKLQGRADPTILRDEVKRLIGEKMSNA
ncbi:MAG: Asp-tRNA(Asn)/Glu-tRNA(Gln) amidotransferase subunit GatB [Crenarchaeota archaeon]|nr:Asp-tRNA(Asn)/Glu-tRNA(Gln) amidotransferase subunit GatB [Thermoproteota archaeon]MDW8034364.1 Asp-tRNA(Asn)/Glu-tRNA(Gln) amidotransferase subunit GatB [Nitrososphaerota archaeon]